MFQSNILYLKVTIGNHHTYKSLTFSNNLSQRINPHQEASFLIVKTADQSGTPGRTFFFKHSVLIYRTKNVAHRFIIPNKN